MQGGGERDTRSEWPQRGAEGAKKKAEKKAGEQEEREGREGWRGEDIGGEIVGVIVGAGLSRDGMTDVVTRAW